MSPRFSVARLPEIRFGSGVLGEVPALVERYGRRALLVTGARSFEAGPAWPGLRAGLQARGIAWETCRVAGEPSPALVDETVADLAGEGIEVVLGIGGGSALDAAKAVAGLLRVGRPVADFLEGVGPELPYPGPALPFIAVPTTAGTGSEATKNAVLSVHGAQGFKKSFRDARLVPRHAVVDPDLLATCPPSVVAANGMDALTQLVESCVSPRANPFTDALGLDAVARVGRALLPCFEAPAEAAEARADMAYGALVSGINLAQTGLGAVHGLAAPLGAFFPIPHGVVCGTLVAEATALNIASLHERDGANPALARYARVAEALTGERFTGPETAWRTLVEVLEAWTERLALPRLGRYGVSGEDLGRIVANSRGSSMKTNPIVLSDAELHALLEARL